MGKQKSNAKVASSIKVSFGSKKPRPGIHAKSRSSKNKKSKMYSKRYRGQGR